MVIDWVTDYIIKERINVIYDLIGIQEFNMYRPMKHFGLCVCHVAKFKQLRYVTIYKYTYEVNI